MPSRLLISFNVAVCLVAASIAAIAQTDAPSGQEQALFARLAQLRPIEDDSRKSAIIRELAGEIQALTATESKLRLVNGLGMLATEADCDGETTSRVSELISSAIQEYDSAGKETGPLDLQLALLVRYKGMQTQLKTQKYLAALRELEAADQASDGLDFTLEDLDGNRWKFRDLKGKVVVVSFWATWCPPCVKEVENLSSVYEELKAKDLVVLGISEDEDLDKLRKFVGDRGLKYPILPDLGGALFKKQLEMLPMMLIYDRNGRFVRRVIDVPSQRKLMELIFQAGLYER